MLELRGERPFLIGVVHLPATPGAPLFGGDVRALLRDAAEDARALADGGCDALIVENFCDAPFFKDHVPPETVAAMTLAVSEVMRAAPHVPVGVNVLRNDARSGLAICAATGADFLRVNVHTGVAISDQGLLEGSAAETLRERARLCPGVTLLCDVHVKHARPLAGGTLAEDARDTLERGLADVLIVSGVATGSAPDPHHLAEVRTALPRAPLLIGSGLDEENARALLAKADGAIVGTWFKRGGEVSEPVDADRVARLRARVDAARAAVRAT